MHFLHIPTELEWPYLGAVTRIQCNRDWSVVEVNKRDPETKLYA